VKVTTYDGEGYATDIEVGPINVELDQSNMLQPRELFLAQGFRPSYIIDRGADGKPLTKTEQVRMVGNSVSPPPARALLLANLQSMVARNDMRKAVVA